MQAAAAGLEGLRCDPEMMASMARLREQEILVGRKEEQARDLYERLEVAMDKDNVRKAGRAKQRMMIIRSTIIPVTPSQPQITPVAPKSTPSEP